MRMLGMTIKFTHVGVVALVVAMLGCAPRITSPSSASGRVGQSFSYQIEATRSPSAFRASLPPPGGLSTDPQTGLISGIPQDQGVFHVELGASNQNGEGTAQLQLTIASDVPPPPSHAVVSEKELFIVNSRVLNAPQAQRGGSWHIRQALQRIAGAGEDVDVFADAWFATWTTNVSLPEVDERFRARPWVTAALRDAWRNDRIQLIAIVNRIDLTRFPNNDSTQPPTQLGEGRFIYEVLGAQQQPLPFTVIFEYGLPMVGDPASALASWAQRWHALGRSDLGAPNEFPDQYLAELEQITDEFSAHGTLNQIRSNEFLVPSTGGRLWELREYHFDSGARRLAQRPVKLTPGISSDNTTQLTAFIQGNESDILGGVPVEFPRELRAAVSPVPNPSFTWRAPNVGDRALFNMSFNSCSGCHAGDTGTLFQHVGVNAPTLSAFLRGPIQLRQPLPPGSNQNRTHDEMGQRRMLLADFAGDAPVGISSARAADIVSQLLKARSGRPH